MFHVLSNSPTTILQSRIYSHALSTNRRQNYCQNVYSMYIYIVNCTRMYIIFNLFNLLTFSVLSFITFVSSDETFDRSSFKENGNIIIENSVYPTLNRQRRYRLKSVEKCEEYARKVGQTKWIMPLSGSRPIPVYINCKNVVNSLISGSEIAETGEFPHMAAIGWILQDRTIGYYCGGSLISHRWIVTAAHCTHGPLGKPVVALLGSNRLSDKKSGESMRIAEIIRHPSYDPPRMYADLALLRLTSKISFGANIKPACLHTEFHKTPLRAWITGWGTTGFEDELSDVLVKAELDVIDNIRCSLLYNSTTSVPGGVVPSMICAGDPKGGWKKDTCHGDSGGPLQIIHSNDCLFEIVGVTSFGKLCGTSGLPGVYTRISHYIDWIESIVWIEDE